MAHKFPSIAPPIQDGEGCGVRPKIHIPFGGRSIPYDEAIRMVAKAWFLIGCAFSSLVWLAFTLWPRNW